MKIAVTGATGFIGSHFTRQALNTGHKVLAHRRSLKSLTRIPLEHEPSWVTKSLEEITSEDLIGCDVLVHFAAHTGNVPYDTLENCLRWNLTAVIALVEKARQAGIQRYVIAGSCFEYGISGERFKCIPTNAPLEPTNSYSASKAAASIALSQWANENNLSMEILRVFHVYGEGEAESRFWPSLRRAARENKDFKMTMGDQIRDFLPVEAVAATFLERAVSLKSTPNVKIFNLSSGKPCTLASFAKRWWRLWEAKGQLLLGEIPYRTNEVMQYIPGDEMLMVKNDRLT